MHFPQRGRCTKSHPSREYITICRLSFLYKKCDFIQISLVPYHILYGALASHICANSDVSLVSRALTRFRQHPFPLNRRLSTQVTFYSLCTKSFRAAAVAPFLTYLITSPAHTQQNSPQLHDEKFKLPLWHSMPHQMLIYISFPNIIFGERFLGWRPLPVTDSVGQLFAKDILSTAQT